MYMGIHVKCPLFSSDFNENFLFSTDFPKNTHIQFRENPSIGNRVLPCGRAGERVGGGGGRTDVLTVIQTDINKLIVAIRNFVNAPKNETYFLP
jgi:hypothetical protein